ncbi:MAG TPA: histidine kinase, partial [Solirubrobacteraceae bacterium]|nr:histidine kinase [Solirubrobacteraceae bacterium]
GRRGAIASDFARAVSARPSLVVAVRRTGPGGRFAGAIATAVDLRVFDRPAASTDFPRRASIVLLGPGSVVLARHPALPGLLGRRVGATPVGQAARREVGDAELNGLDGVRRIYGFDRIGEGREALVVAAGLSRSEIAAPADRTLHRTLLVLGLIALLAVPAALLVANLLIARPVRGDAAARQGEIEHSVRERQRLLAELVAVEEQERERIAGDIHDDSLQALAVLMLRLELLEARIEDDDVRASLVEARESARAAVARLRHMIFQLTPPELETIGLAAALEKYLAEIGRVWDRETSVRSELDADPVPESRALIYRIAIEGVNNAAKHAGDGRIDVERTPQDGGVRVAVRDDGVGFEVEAVSPVPGHLGLGSMRDRATAAGGWWRVESAPGQGTTVEFFVPGG